MNDSFEIKPIEFYRDKKVCVTGATGLIGSYVVKILKASGAIVLATSLRKSRGAGLSTMRDLLDPLSTKFAVEGCDIVIGCAGITGGIGLAHKDPLGYVGPATVIALNTLHACAQAKVKRFGFLSSTTVYPELDKPVVETDTFDWPPYELYKGIGESKRFLEKMCTYYAEKTGLKVGVVRPSGAYGRFDNFDESTSHVIPGMINRALSLKPGEPFEVWGDGNDVRDFVHAQDVARGLLLAVADDEASSKAMPINIASGVGISTRKLATVIRDVLDMNYDIVTNPSKPTALKYRVASIEKAQTMLGFEPKIGLEEGLRDTIAWLKTERGSH